MTKLVAVDAEAMDGSIGATALALEDGKHFADSRAKPSHGRRGRCLLVGDGRRFVSAVEIAL